jgi:hydrogenase expression/formation protein HypC
MCLAVPGKIESIENGEQSDPFSRTGKVNFGGILKQVNLAYVPEANIGDYVLVHVGFAISVIDEQQALETMNYLKEMDELAGMEETR